MRSRRFKTPSRTSPTNRKRGCLCADNTYSSKCCDGSLQAQGIGSITQSLYPDIVVSGSHTVTIQYNEAYNDLGATASDSLDGDLTSSIVVTSNVNPNVLGEYTVLYSVTNSRGYEKSAQRKVRVENTTVPIITLIGASDVSISYQATYNDLGATALSSYYGDITNQIITDNPVNSSVVTSYVVRYNVIDASGNQATQVTRNVNITYTEIPVITLAGDSVVEVTQGDSYIDAGVTANSTYYGNITNDVITNNLVNTSNLGSYQVLYNVTDASGNVAVQVTRTVNVIPHQSYWMSLARGYSVEPVLHTTLSDGEVYTYVYTDQQGASTTLYRYIKTDLTLDAFYSGFDGVTLSGLITQKQIIV